MSAFALYDNIAPSRNYLGVGNYVRVPSPGHYSQKIQEIRASAHNHLINIPMGPKAILAHQIEGLFNAGLQYATADYLAKNLSAPISDIEKTLSLFPERFERALFSSENGSPVYLFKTNLSLLRKYWDAFRHWNAVKYGR